MRILLLGEFSALHKNLRDGLRELGHEAAVGLDGVGVAVLRAGVLGVLAHDRVDLRRLVHSPVISADEQAKALKAVLTKAGSAPLTVSRRWSSLV